MNGNSRINMIIGYLVILETLHTFLNIVLAYKRVFNTVKQGAFTSLKV